MCNDSHGLLCCRYAQIVKTLELELDSAKETSWRELVATSGADVL